MTIRIRLGVILAERGVSLTELSAMVDVSVQNLSILKSGRARAIRFSTLEAICRALDCSPGDLIELDDQPDEGRSNVRELRPLWARKNRSAPP